MKATYHDHCCLGRYSRLDDAPREILAAVPGLKLVEMERNAWMPDDAVPAASSSASMIML